MRAGKVVFAICFGTGCDPFAISLHVSSEFFFFRLLYWLCVFGPIAFAAFLGGFSLTPLLCPQSLPPSGFLFFKTVLGASMLVSSP